MADAWTILPTIINSRTHAGKRRKNNSPLMKCHRGTPGTRKLGNSEFPDVVGGEGGSGGHGGAGDPPRLGQEGKRKLTESAREFPKAFRLAESVRVAPGGAGALAGPTTSELHCLVTQNTQIGYSLRAGRTFPPMVTKRGEVL